MVYILDNRPLRRRYHLKYKGKNIRIRYDTRLVFYSFSRCIRLWLVNESNNWLIQFTIMTGSEPNLTGSDPDFDRKRNFHYNRKFRF